ncbi:MAG TPA: hypothetical protein VG055_32740 [Planctomycetaceae bacterium]|jgi:hypothetical protein|nr:hypothetical protein [Planctomycetaceae bacterium]
MKYSRFWAATVAVLVLAVTVGPFAIVTHGGDPPPSSPHKAVSTDEKIDRILDRLDRIERRLNEIAPPRAGEFKVNLAPQAARAATRTWTLDESTGLPNMPQKPTPRSTTFKNCGAEGSGGDGELNRLKNRVDKWSEWIPVKFGAVRNLDYPAELPRKRAAWPLETREAVSRYEGVPIAVEGFIAYTKAEGPESCNCGEDADDMVDFHLSLVTSSEDDKSDSIVVEVTPRIRAQHPKWTYDLMKSIKKSENRVRISGWLMLDQWHPEAVGKSRGTIWEIHPIMEIEIKDGGRWVKADDWEPEE